MTDNAPAPAAGRDYRSTVFLPNTPFPMRGDLPKKEPGMLARWEQMDIWGKLRAKQGQYMVLTEDGRVLKRGHDLATVLRVLELALVK